MLINGAIGYSDIQRKEDSFYLVATILGAIFFGIGVLLLGKFRFKMKTKSVHIKLFAIGLFLRQSRRLCCRTGKDPLDPATGQALTVNPSTDLLVAAQYAPVSEVAYQPPSEDTEQSKLMPQENKDK